MQDVTWEGDIASLSKARQIADVQLQEEIAVGLADRLMIFQLPQCSGNYS